MSASPRTSPIRPRSWSHDDVVEAVQRAMAATKPGLDAHLLMAPRPRVGWRPAHVPAEARDAAALLLLYPQDGWSTLALTVRLARLPHHGGQVSLPGGGVEPGETIEEAALREAVEEVGLDAAVVTVAGRLSPLHIPVSGFVLHPVVAFSPERPVFVPAADEVARIVEVPLEVLARRETVRLRVRRHEGRDFEVPYFAVDHEQVWGATAMVLGEFLWVIGCAPSLPAEGVVDHDRP